MADTTAPVLLELDLPSVIEADAFHRTLLVTARAADPGGEGVRRVVVYVDKPLHLRDHIWFGTTDAFSIDGLYQEQRLRPDRGDRARNLSRDPGEPVRPGTWPG